MCSPPGLHVQVWIDCLPTVHEGKSVPVRCIKNAFAYLVYMYMYCLLDGETRRRVTAKRQTRYLNMPFGKLRTALTLPSRVTKEKKRAVRKRATLLTVDKAAKPLLKAVKRR